MRHTRRNKSRINGPARTLTERKRKKKSNYKEKKKKYSGFGGEVR